jgi:signal transduction histidine kinase
MLARTLLKPIRELATLVQCIHRGDFSKRVAVHGQDEIGMLGAAFNSAAEELTRQEQLRKDLLHDVAHELRSPLTNIRCQLESLQDGLTSATAETLGSIYEEAMHLSRLVDDLRDIALAEAGHLSLEIVDCNATLELHRVMRTASPIANARSIRMVLDAPPFLWVSADPGRLAQIMNNLVVNAIQHTPTGCFVTIRARAEGSLALIEVADDGPGIPAEHLPFIFDRFYRVDPSRSRKTSGAGLGLAIAKQLATLQGGSLKVKSEGGHGSCFILSVPLQLSTRE